jgi:ribA/ribD-fused uncharacterized protein
MRVTDYYVFFWGGIYSQWYASPFVSDGRSFSCAEQYMMYHKAQTFHDSDAANAIMNTQNPKEQKALGRQVRNYDDTKWREVARDIVYTGNLLKFGQNELLKNELMETGSRILVEASPMDRVWGVGLHETDDAILDPTKWRGTNWLGEALGRVREAFAASLRA